MILNAKKKELWQLGWLGEVSLEVTESDVSNELWSLEINELWSMVLKAAFKSSGMSRLACTKSAEI